MNSASANKALYFTQQLLHRKLSSQSLFCYQHCDFLDQHFLSLKEKTLILNNVSRHSREKTKVFCQVIWKNAGLRKAK